MRPPRAQLKQLARQRANILLDRALETAKKDVKLAQRQAEVARRICMRFNIKLPSERKRLFCKGCKRLIVPGVNARVRLASRPVQTLRITCLECGHTYRKILSD